MDQVFQVIFWQDGMRKLVGKMSLLVGFPCALLQMLFVGIGYANMCLGDELRDVPDLHTEMEGRLRMNW